MDPELERRILDLLDVFTDVCEATDKDARKFGREILTHLSRINSTLSAIDCNLTLLEMKK